ACGGHFWGHGITRYRWTEKLDGIWQTSFPDTFDTEFLAAAKTLFDGRRRISFGWIGILEGENDLGARQWRGHMALPRELVYKPNGSLSVKLPEEFEIWHAKNSSPLPLKNYKPVCGNWQFSELGATTRTLNGVSVLQCDAPLDFFLSAEIFPQGKACEFGFLLRMQDGKGYKLVLNKSHIALMNWSSWGDVEPRLSRPVTWKEGERLKFQLIVHGSILEIFISDTTSLTGRIYKTSSGWLGLYAANGEVEFQNMKVAPLRPLD
ncbi:MAG: GH32 C-terminal domain-containing protein, partial [Candidatus Fervidibacter sp.]|uniref:GH32 C-terminal domain-containing protein n=1 Tax=Candidatus Fervidibacter sp. TaxID=3100871 RepID=UPI00404B0BC2